MNRANPAVVGGFVLSGLALGVAVILLFGSSHLLSPTVHAVVYFQGSVANLEVGAPVTFRGVRVGAVTRVAVSLSMSDLTALIPVYLDINPDEISIRDKVDGQTVNGFDRLLKAGLRAQLNLQSLITGQLRVDLDILPDTPATTYGPVPERIEIPTVPSKLQTLEDEIAALPLKEIGENANQALLAIRRVADDLPPRIGSMADSFKQTSEAARAALDDFDKLAIISQQQIATNGDKLAIVLTSSDRTMQNVDAMVVSLRNMTAANSPMRSDLEATLRDLSASASSLRSFTHDIERDPSSLLTGRTRP